MAQWTAETKSFQTNPQTMKQQNVTESSSVDCKFSYENQKVSILGATFLLIIKTKHKQNSCFGTFKAFKDLK